MRRVIIFAALIAVSCMQVFAVDGIAVSTSFSYGIERTVGGWRGSIVRFDIQNSNVVKCDTIHSIRDGVAHFPCISMDGKRVCFFKDGDTYADGIRTEGTADHITVMNIDGTGKQNVVEFTGALTKNIFYQTGYGRQMDWPKGDWIYYNKPGTPELWKVKYNDPSTKTHIATWPCECTTHIRRWNLSGDGTRCAATFSAGWCSTFPDMKNRSTDPGGCNLSISASGRFTAFWGGRPCKDDPVPEDWGMPGHSLFSFGDWNWSTSFVDRGIGFCKRSYVNLNMVAEWLGRDSVGRGMELIRWAANSDKWVLHHVGWKGWAGETSRYGSNQLLYNWADKKAIFTSSNPFNSGEDHNQILCNMAGDFWIKPPKDEYIGTHYETIYGTWLPLGTYPEGPLPGYVTGESVTVRKPASAIATTNAGKFSIAKTANGHILHFGRGISGLVSLYDNAGRKVFASSLSGSSVRIPVSTRGAYILRLSVGNKTLLSRRIMI